MVKSKVSDAKFGMFDAAENNVEERAGVEEAMQDAVSCPSVDGSAASAEETAGARGADMPVAASRTFLAV